MSYFLPDRRQKKKGSTKDVRSKSAASKAQGPSGQLKKEKKKKKTALVGDQN
jgi:hypothetical protein